MAGNPFGFTGENCDPTTGLYDLRARSYDTATRGREVTVFDRPGSEYRLIGYGGMLIGLAWFVVALAKAIS